MNKKKSIQNSGETDEPSVGPIMEQHDLGELRKTKPQVTGEQSALGHMPNPEEVYRSSVLDVAEDVGLYTESDESHPSEIDLAQEVAEAEMAEGDGDG